MKLFESAGILYRGTNPVQPDEVWHYRDKRWVPYCQDRLDPAEVREIDAEQAEQLKSDNPHAEHYFYYDTPPWAQGYSEASRPYKAAPGRRAFKIFEKDGAWFRMPAEREALIVDEILRNGQWVPYERNRIAPAMFGNLILIEEIDE